MTEQLRFLTQILPFEPRKAYEELGEVPLEDVEVLYVYGLGEGSYYPRFVPWLAGDPFRRLVCIEDDVAALDAFLNSPHAEAMSAHSQVHVKFLIEPSMRKEFIEGLAREFPFRTIHVAALPSYRDRLRSFKQLLLRRTTVHNALLQEDLHYVRLFQNLLPNFSRLAHASQVDRMGGVFANIPAIICGAGPSLEQALPFLRECEDKALIFAGGSTITALSKKGVLPHCIAAMDPNREEYRRLKENIAFEVPLIYGNRVHPGIFQTLNGPLAYVRTSTGGYAELWMEEALNMPPTTMVSLDQEALSVTTTILQCAVHFGCNPIIFVGVDLAFTGMKSYADGVIEDSAVLLEKLQKDRRSSEQLVVKKQGKEKIYTLIKWVMEAGAIGRFVRKHPQVKVYNGSHGGLNIPGVPRIQLADVPLHKTYDLRGIVHEALQKARPPETSVVEEKLHELRESLERCAVLVDTIVSKSDHEYAILPFEMELKDEIAYRCLLHGTLSSYEFLSRDNSLSAKWKEIASLIGIYKGYFENRRAVVGLA